MASAIHPSQSVNDERETRVFSSPGSKKLLDLERIVEPRGRACRRDMCRLRWLSSQIIGAESEIETPFGRRRMVYCDHTVSGRFLKCVEKYLMAEVLPFYGNTHTLDNHVGQHMSNLVKEAKEYIKQCLGAGPDDALIFCGSGSTAAIKRLQEVMGIAAPPPLRRRLLASLSPDERWVVFLGPYEHHSNLLSWRQSLAEVVEIGLTDGGKIDLVALEEALLSPKYYGRPKLGSFSACSNVTGIHTDTRAVARLLHLHGAFACFDFACSGPYSEIDMRSGEDDGYDAIFLSPHKFLGGPGSPGILLMNSALYLLKGDPPTTAGGGTVLYVNGQNEEETIYCKDLEEREDSGTPPIVQKLRAALAFAAKSYAGRDLIRQREAALWQRANSRLSKNNRIRVLGHNYEDNQPIFSFVVYPTGYHGGEEKHLHCHFVGRLLNDLFGIQARGGCACAGPYGHLLLGVSREQSLAYRTAIEKGYEGLKPGFTRVSFAYYMTAKEVQFVLDAIEMVAKYGHRFLPLYAFDWKTGAWDFIGKKDRLLPLSGSLEAVLRSSREKFAGILREVRPLFNCGGSISEAPAPPYSEYLRVARQLAEGLPESRALRVVPEGIDPQLISFMF